MLTTFRWQIVLLIFTGCFLSPTVYADKTDNANPRSPLPAISRVSFPEDHLQSTNLIAKSAGRLWKTLTGLWTPRPAKPSSDSSSSASRSRPGYRAPPPPATNPDIPAPRVGPVGYFLQDPPKIQISGKFITSGNWHALADTSLRALRFYRPADGHFEFANTCAGYPLMIGGNIYLSTEHYFQCESFGGPQSPVGSHFTGRAPVAGINPTDAARYARGRRQHKLDNWIYGLSNQYMRRALDAKFNFDSYPLLAMRLVKTLEEGYPILVENSDYDQFWGAALLDTTIQGRGNNKLGIMLMEVRYSLLQQFNRFDQPTRDLLDNAYQRAKTGDYRAYRTLPSKLGFSMYLSQH